MSGVGGWDPLPGWKERVSPILTRNLIEMPTLHSEFIMAGTFAKEYAVISEMENKEMDWVPQCCHAVVSAEPGWTAELFGEPLLELPVLNVPARLKIKGKYKVATFPPHEHWLWFEAMKGHH